MLLSHSLTAVGPGARRGQLLVAVPPTVMPSISSVGVPTPTGTDWPSLPQVHDAVDELEVVADASSPCAGTSGPLPIRFTPLSGAVSLPSSIR